MPSFHALHACCGLLGALLLAASARAEDCNGNGVLDATDLAAGTSLDCNTNGVPDECDTITAKAYDPTLGTLPEAQGFTLVQSTTYPSPPCTLVAGTLHQGPTTQLGYQYYKAGDVRLDFTTAFELEVDLEVRSSNYKPSCYGTALAGYGLSATDDALRLFYIWIASDRLILQNRSNDLATGISTTTTGPPRHYRFLVIEGDAWLLVDDEALLAAGVGAPGQGAPAFRNTVWFGDGTSCAQSETYLHGLIYRSPADPDGGHSPDCNLNGVPDECEFDTDCNTNGIPDACDMIAGTSGDCNSNGMPDDCELFQNDCNTDGVPDECELVHNDCNSNALPDDCEPDCNVNGLADVCDLAAATSTDCNTNGTPDECEPDCNTNGVADGCDLAGGTSPDCNTNGVPDECEADCNTNGIPDVCDIGGGTSLDCTANGTPDECEPDCNSNAAADTCDLAAGTSADCNTNGIPDECDIRFGTSSDCNSNGRPDACDLAGGSSVDLNGDGNPDECETVIFVDAGAMGVENGTSWMDAFTDLQDALAAAAVNGRPSQIWVAVGIYAPASAGGSRTASFQLRNRVGLYGGFVGYELSFDERDPETNPTVLSGDLNANDGSGVKTDNSYRVVNGSGVDATAVLDGFIIVAGNADGTSPYNRGAGLYVNGGHPTVRHGVFARHSARYGAVYLVASNARFTDCSFETNTAYLGGGLHGDSNAHPTLRNCSFLGNAADYGGAAFLAGSSTTVVVNSLFVGNRATQDGGAAYVSSSAPTLTNCTLSTNLAARDGGGVYVTANANPALQNCILWGNQDAGGTDTSAQIHLVSGSATVSYSGIQGGWTGPGSIGNIAAAPDFQRDPNDGGDGWGVGGNDDFGDLRLQRGSPAIDAGNNAADTDRALAGIQTLPAIDLNGETRFFDDPLAADTGAGPPPLVDLGAYEFHTDCNENGLSDDADIAAGTSRDCNSNAVPDECEPDCNINGAADPCDLAAGTSADCNINRTPDECEIAAGTAPDCDANWVPDPCQADTDGDGCIDACDGCLNDPDKQVPGICGCGVSDQDADDDTVPDCVDLCPDTPLGEEIDTSGCPVRGACCFGVGICFEAIVGNDCRLAKGRYQGSGSTCVHDSDGDGGADCFEECPADPGKTGAGICGCGVPDDGADADADGVWDCVDICPSTPGAEAVDGEGCSVYGACCFTTGPCFSHTTADTCALIHGVFEGNQSSCNAGCAFGTAGDFDGDGAVDAADHARFRPCLSGPEDGAGYAPPAPQCRTVFDFDFDTDVDLRDFAAFTRVFH